MQVRPSRWLPPKGYSAITFFGHILIRKEFYKDWVKEQESESFRVLCHHEWIHLLQAASVHNSWILYYVFYIWYHLKSRPLRYGSKIAYMINPFEMEAYLFESDMEYAKESEEGATAWRQLAQYPPSFWRAMLKEVSDTGYPSRAKFLKKVRDFMKDKW